jgi:hypothetical protein
MHGFTATELNRPREGLGALTQIDERGPQGGVIYWGHLTDARHVLGEHERELADARRGLERAPSTATLLYEVRALAALGRVAEVGARLDESAALPTNPWTSSADVLEVAALELRAHGHSAAARATAERALRWYRARPEQERRTEPHRFALARSLYLAGRWDEARAAFERLAATRPDNPAYLGYLGVLAARRGDRREAERISTLLAGLRTPYLRGVHTNWRARIAAVLGERERATALVADALQQGQVYGPELHSVPDFETLRDFPPYRELMRPKG